LERQKEQTRATKKKTGCPQFDESYELYATLFPSSHSLTTLPCSYLSDPEANFEVEIYKVARLRSNKLIGKVVVPVSKLTDGEENDSWHTIHDKEQKPVGSLRLVILYRKEK